MRVVCLLGVARVSRRGHQTVTILEAKPEREDNDVELQKLFRAFRVAALGLSAEIVILIAMVSDNLF
jgi:hypothetical protein